MNAHMAFRLSVINNIISVAFQEITASYRLMCVKVSRVVRTQRAKPSQTELTGAPAVLPATKSPKIS